MQIVVMISIILICSAVISQAQILDYRGSFVDEATRSDPNTATALNEGNHLLPQPRWTNIGTASLSLGLEPVSTTIGLSTTTTSLVNPTYSASIHELAADLSLSDDLNLLVGKKILKWGTGYAFNPTGVVEPPRSPSDPTDRLNQNDGRTLISLTAFLGKNSLTFVYLNDVQISIGSFKWNTSEYAFRAYAFLDGLDLSLVGHYREGDRLQAGANCSYVIGEGLELHGEVLAQQGSSMVYHPILQSDNSQQTFTSYPYVPLYDHSGRVFARTLVGGQYTFDNGINVVLEYSHNGEGLSRKEWQRWMNFVTFQNDVQQGRLPAPKELVSLSGTNLLWALNTLSPRGTMRDYLFGRGYWSDDRWSIETLIFMNADDASMVIIPAVTLKVSKYASLYTRFTSYLGSRGTEFGSLFTRASLSLGLQVQI